MIGKTISHYKILEELGRGGMGVVYLAEDTKLDRKVALKFLAPGALGGAEEKARFAHEAKAAAALTHPNICTIYEIDEYEGQSFIAMEYVDGGSLRERIAGGPLRLDEAIDIVRQVAAGLEKAHEKGIVHRDIKSANIMITGEGQVKIMDFGLAKSRGVTQLTKEGTTLGTIQYMSPEQARGAPVDHRSDIWSLGVVLFEMVTGRFPFGGDYDQAVIYSILNDEPEPLTAIRTGVPVELERIVNRCLEKDPAERYQTARDLSADLHRLERPESSSAWSERVEAARARRSGPRGFKTPMSRRLWMLLLWVPAIAYLIIFVIVPRYFSSDIDRGVPKSMMLAVLPFENLGPPDDEYFADGITDAITARLAGLSGLGVISRQSAMQYKHSDKDVRTIGEELGVDYILEGTIQRERPSDPTSRVRIIPQLIQCANDIHIWAETYDEDMTEVFRMQSEIAEQVARELDVALLEPERRELAEKPTENLEAYEYYLRGLEYADRRTNEEASLKCVRLFGKAVELDPGFAVAWAQLSISHTWLYWRSYQDREALEMARHAVDEAMLIDPDLPEAHLALGYYYYYGSRDYERALEHFRAVLKQRPEDFMASEGVGCIKRRQGKWDEALEIFERTYPLNPRSYLTNYDNFGNTNLFLGRYDEAERYLDRAMVLVPNMPSAYISKAQIAILRDGDRESAGSYIREAIRSTPPERRCNLLFFEEEPTIRAVFASPCERVHMMHPSDCEALNAYESAAILLLRAQCNIEIDRNEEAAALLDSARVILEHAIEGVERPHPTNHLALALVYAYLGRSNDAIREGKLTTELMPISKDAFDGPYYVEALAEIYTIVGEYEAAIDQLEILSSVPSLISGNYLRLDPMWDPLRDNPRFQRLLDEGVGSGS